MDTPTKGVRKGGRKVENRDEKKLRLQGQLKTLQHQQKLLELDVQRVQLEINFLKS